MNVVFKFMSGLPALPASPQNPMPTIWAPLKYHVSAQSAGYFVSNLRKLKNSMVLRSPQPRRIDIGIGIGIDRYRYRYRCRYRYIIICICAIV